jgi:hypothetical protein
MDITVALENLINKLFLSDALTISEPLFVIPEKLKRTYSIPDRWCGAKVVVIQGVNNDK